MVKVITYGTFDLLHEGHIKLLQRAKALGDYLIVGVTNDNFDRQRGKLNVRRTVLERVAAVQALGIADKIVIEDYVGQKIDDVQKYEVDIFAIGSDWTGAFDFLKEYCQVVYLPRTEGISSTILRAETQPNLRIGVVGCGRIASRFISESSYVEAVEIKSFYDLDQSVANAFAKRVPSAKIAVSYEALLSEVDAVYIATPHVCHYQQCKDALLAGKHVLCETPLVLNGQEARELYALAQERSLVLLEANKTAFCPAFNHLIVLIKTGAIGDVVGIDASESKLWDKNKLKRELDYNQGGGSLYEMGSYPLLPIIRILGTDIKDINIYSRLNSDNVDVYTRGVVQYAGAVASFQLGLGVKTEGNLVISGTKGYAYVPAPWWKTDYFELRYEDQNMNKKYFYAWDGAGLRYEIQEFASCIFNNRYSSARLRPSVSICMADVFQQFAERRNFKEI